MRNKNDIDAINARNNATNRPEAIAVFLAVLIVGISAIRVNEIP